jgi:6-phosphogluconate dehydrogenase
MEMETSDPAPDPDPDPWCRRVLLVGMMASGKTTVGRRLAADLGWPYLDNDDIVRRASGTTTAGLLANSGETALRAAELAALDAVLAADPPVVASVAAGVVGDSGARGRMRAGAFVVHLRAPVAVLAGRAERDHERPWLRGDAVSALELLAAGRDRRYRSVADLVVDVAERSPGAIAAVVAWALAERCGDRGGRTARHRSTDRPLPTGPRRPRRRRSEDPHMTTRSMQVGMVGLGRMGANLSRRLMAHGHRCVVHDVDPGAVAALSAEGATGADSLHELVAMLEPPRVVWLMLPAGNVRTAVQELSDLLDAGDVVVDGGNSYYRDDLIHASLLGAHGVELVDCGTSGGVWGLERGYCLMIGGDDEVVARLDPIWRALAPGEGAAPPTPDRGPGGTAHLGYLHCGPTGAGHFVKMVHNGVEYGMMAALAEGLAVLDGADAGLHPPAVDAETTPLRHPEHYRYRFDLAEVAELWRRGSVVSSWLVDLTAAALASSPELDGFEGRVSDSGEGRWTVIAAVEEGVPAPVITAALTQRFESRGLGATTGRILSALRSQFGGHAERPDGD